VEVGGAGVGSLGVEMGVREATSRAVSVASLEVSLERFSSPPEHATRATKSNRKKSPRAYLYIVAIL
jgi:hypothetical protein